MGKKKSLSADVRLLILQGKQDGISNRQLGRLFGCSEKAVRDLLKRFRDTGSVQDRPRSGRPPKLSIRQQRTLVRSCVKDRKKTAYNHQQELTKFGGPQVSLTTVRRILRRYGLRGCIALKKPFISAKNRNSRLQWAKYHLHWSPQKWSTVLFSDEKKFNRLGSDGRVYVRRRVGEALLPNCLRGTVKGGGVSLMAWVCFSARGTGPLHRIHGIMDQHVYRQVMEEVMLSHAEDNMPLRWWFQQDNDPKDTAKSEKRWFGEKRVPVLPWPSQSPDLNPIENLWNMVDATVKGASPTTVDELERVLHDAWAAIPRSTCARLVASMPRRCAAVIKRKGYATKY